MTHKNLILLHGALGCKIQFENLSQMLSNQFDVLTLDFEGHGGRYSDQDFSMELFADNVLAFLHDNEISKAHLFGYSMGGYVALQLATTHSERIDKIMTLGTKFDWTKEVAEKEVKMLIPEKIEQKVPAFAQHLEQLHTANDWKDVMAKTAQMMLDLGNGKRMTDEEFSKIKNEILIGIGSKDHMVSVDESKHVSELLPNGELMIVEDCPHPIEKVDMDKLAGLMSSFYQM